MRHLALLTLAACVATPAVASAQDATMIAPADTMLVAHVDIARLKASPIVQSAQKMFGDVSKSVAKELQDAPGFNAEKDIDGVTIFLPPDFEKSESFALALSGRLDKSKIEAAIKADGGKPMTHNNNTFWVAERDAAIAFVTNLLVLGDQRAIKAVLDSQGTAQLLGKSAPLSQLMQRTDKKAAIWFAAQLTGKTRAEASKALSELVPGADVQAVSASLNLSKGLRLRTRVVLNSPKSAAGLIDVAKTVHAEAKKGSGMPATVANMLGDMKLTTDGADALVEINLSPEQVTQAMTLVGVAVGLAAMADDSGKADAQPVKPIK